MPCMPNLAAIRLSCKDKMWGGGDVQTDTHRDAATLYSTIVLCICSYIIGVRYGE